MRNIIRNKKAKAVPMIAIIIVILVIVAGVVIYVYPGITGSEPYWETPNEFGIWQDELVIEFEDGSNQSLKIIEESIGKPFAVNYGGKAVISIALKLSATATGTGYDSVFCKMTNFGYICNIKQGSTVKFSTDQTTSWTDHKGIDESWLLREAYVGIKAEMDNKPDKYPDGTYTAEFIPSGTFEYRGMHGGTPDGDFQTATLLPSRTVTLTVTGSPTSQILITLSSDIVTI